MNGNSEIVDYPGNACIDDIRIEFGGDRVPWPKAWTTPDIRSYPRFTEMELPVPGELEMTLDQALRARQSTRASRRISLEQLATLLGAAVGVGAQDGVSFRRRPYPSAGARYPIEIYLLVRQVSGMKSGRYWYSPLRHVVVRLPGGPVGANQLRVLIGPEWVATTQAVLVLSTVDWRVGIKYGDRGKRYSLMECGHIMQNFSLCAAAMNMGFVPVGGFADAALAFELNLDPSLEAPLYCGVIP